MVKKAIAVILTMIMCIGLSGCGENQIPEMSQGDLQAIGEYAAITLMKYDASNRSRLVDLSRFEESAEEIDKPQSPEVTTKPEGMKPTADTPTENLSQNGNQYNIEEVMGLPGGVMVTFVGQEICDQYPYEGTDNYFSVTAGNGRKLLVLKFSMENRAEQAADVNMMSSDCTYQVTVNGSYTRRALTTMLLNDMSTYIGTIQSGESVEAVLIVETDKEKVGEVTTAELKLKNESKTRTIQLF